MKLFFIFSIVVIAAIASLSSFIIHVFTVEWLPTWVGDQMDGVTIKRSWDVRYVAGVTSIEYGLAAVSLYYLARKRLLKLGIFKAFLIYSLLLAAVHGVFIRQPLMDYVVGNPLHVVLVQNGFKWLVWFLMSFVIVFGYEMIASRLSANKLIQPPTDAPAD